MTVIRIGYNFGSQVETSLTNALVFYPIGENILSDRSRGPQLTRPRHVTTATVLCLFSTLALVPLLYGYPTTKYPFRAYSLLTFTTFVVSSVAFVFAVGLWGTVVTKFSAEGVGVTFGPLVSACETRFLHCGECTCSRETPFFSSSVRRRSAVDVSRRDCRNGVGQS